MSRRITTLLIVAFLAGPAMNWTCLVSCWGAAASDRSVAAIDSCHRSGGGGPVISHGQACNPDQPRVTPLVKASPAPVFALAGVPHQMSARLTRAAIRTNAAVVADTGPPGPAAFIPLRI